eukprot:jgi/Tetstr1/449583/TSEL_036670.t1
MRPDLLEPTHSARAGAKSAGDEDEYLAGAGVDVGVAATAAGGAGAKVSMRDGVGRLSSELPTLCEATFR